MTWKDKLAIGAILALFAANFGLLAQQLWSADRELTDCRTRR
jgi:hypothetical protein